MPRTKVREISIMCSLLCSRLLLLLLLYYYYCYYYYYYQKNNYRLWAIHIEFDRPLRCSHKRRVIDITSGTVFGFFVGVQIVFIYWFRFVLLRLPIPIGPMSSLAAQRSSHSENAVRVLQ